MVVIGCPREPHILQMTRDPIPELVARTSGKPLVMVRAAAGLRSWIRRWI